jgi:hypothetical protein
MELTTPKRKTDTLVAYIQALIIVNPKIFGRAATVFTMDRIDSQNRGPRVSAPESNF